MKFYLSFLCVFGLYAKDPVIIDLGGPYLGEALSTVKLKAKSKKKPLEGPKKREIDPVSQIDASAYVVSKGKNLMKNRRVKQQTFFFMNEKLIACELLFTYPDGLEKYRAKLTKSGFKTTDKKKRFYTAIIDGGSFKGLLIQVEIGSRMTTGKFKKKLFVALIKCYQVLGEDFDEDSIRESQGKNKADDNGVENALERAL
ncbi:MAG: hypothetical protein HRT89_17805 [Lentisphaeria bacterium]|nr:hypothetical protein [Lentisphaeria bacterium]NQZ69913.1 hypothetical protein [Lentisphaeria bacterium]